MNLGDRTGFIEQPNNPPYSVASPDNPLPIEKTALNLNLSQIKESEGPLTKFLRNINESRENFVQTMKIPFAKLRKTL